MKNYKLIIQYDGTHYSGWQIQENAPSVQMKIIEAIETIIQVKVNLIGSGRTDAGVHAFGQTANFRIDHELNLYRFKYSLNSILPRDIAVTFMEETAESFHSRFDAKKRSYIYLISKKKSPFYFNYSYLYKGKIDTKKLNIISKAFIGENDFTSFAKKNYEIDNADCTIYDLHWRSSKDLILFYIEANRFLHGMVRSIIGTILNAAKNNFDEKYVRDIFNEKKRESAAESVPAKGLFLYKVKY